MLWVLKVIPTSTYNIYIPCTRSDSNKYHNIYISMASDTSGDSNKYPHPWELVRTIGYSNKCPKYISMGTGDKGNSNK